MEIFNIVIIMRILIGIGKKAQVFAFRKRNFFFRFFGGWWKKERKKKLKSIEFSYRRKICRTGKKNRKKSFSFLFFIFGRVVIMYLLVCGKLGVIEERKERKRKKEILVKPHRRKNDDGCIGISECEKGTGKYQILGRMI